MLPVNYRGQSLACGLSIAAEGRAGESTLVVVDPASEQPANEPISVEDAEDALLRGVASKALSAAGFGATAAVIAAPSGGSRDRAREELGRRHNMHRFFLDEQEFTGRRIEILLPMEFQFDTRSIESVELTYGVEIQHLESLSRDIPNQQGLNRSVTAWLKATGDFRIVEQDLGGSFCIGTFFAIQMGFL
jgi:hypothetical protein